MLNLIHYLIIVLAALAAGAINALAGGGTLITFPVLTAVGIPAVAANMTNTVALCPGYLGGILAQRKDLQGQARRLWLFIPAGIAGGLLGGLLLEVTSEHLFRALVPYLILIATGLLASQKQVRAWLMLHTQNELATSSERWGLIPVGVAAIYGGYFGAGMSVIILAILGITVDDTLTRLNALKQVVSFSTNVAAAVFFVFSRQIVWPAAIVMFVGAMIGGSLGGKFAGRVKPAVLRQVVVVVGIVVAIIYFVY